MLIHYFFRVLNHRHDAHFLKSHHDTFFKIISVRIFSRISPKMVVQSININLIATLCCTKVISLSCIRIVNLLISIYGISKNCLNLVRYLKQQVCNYNSDCTKVSITVTEPLLSCLTRHQCFQNIINDTVITIEVLDKVYFIINVSLICITNLSHTSIVNKRDILDILIHFYIIFKRHRSCILTLNVVLNHTTRVSLIEKISTGNHNDFTTGFNCFD